jgi:hypothetical protein
MYLCRAWNCISAQRQDTSNVVGPCLSQKAVKTQHRICQTLCILLPASRNFDTHCARRPQCTAMPWHASPAYDDSDGRSAPSAFWKARFADNIAVFRWFDGISFTVYVFGALCGTGGCTGASELTHRPGRELELCQGRSDSVRCEHHSRSEDVPRSIGLSAIHVWYSWCQAHRA